MLVVFFGPSCGGKSAIQKALEDIYRKVTTATTRIPRAGEVNGRHYYFLSKEEFLEAESEGKFLETNPYAENLYGTPYESIEKAINSGEVRTIVLDINGYETLKEKYGDRVHGIYIGASEKTLTKRFKERGDSIKQVEIRIEKALSEELSDEYISKADSIVWNNKDNRFEYTLKLVRDTIQLLL